MLTPRRSFAACSGPNGNIYVAGGIQGWWIDCFTVNSTEVFSGSTWTNSTEVPEIGDEGHWATMADRAAPDGNLWIAGGDHSDGFDW